MSAEFATGRLIPLAAGLGVGAAVWLGGAGVATADSGAPVQPSDSAAERAGGAPQSRGETRARVPLSRPNLAARTRDQSRANRSAAAGSAAALPRPAAISANRATSARTGGKLVGLAGLFNNQTPQLNPVQRAQSPTGVITGQLNGVDPDSSRLTYSVSAQPTHGVAVVNPDGSYFYTPDPAVAVSGISDAFSVTVSDAASGFAIHGLAGLIHVLSFGLIGERGDSSTSRITVTVLPIGSADNPPTGTWTLDSLDPVTGVVAGVVSGSDPDGDTLAFAAPATTAKGAVVIDSATGSLTYTPTAAARLAASAPGATEADRRDTFAVTITDGRGASGSVLVAVPVAVVSAIDYREEMREFVIRISQQARSVDPDFIVVPQNGQELITLNGAADGPLAVDYAAAIDGQGREDLFYGYRFDNVATAAADRDYLLDFLSRQEDEGIQVLVTDYCRTPAFVNDSYRSNEELGFISFAASHRELDNIPALPATPHNVNGDDVATLADAKNLLYILDTGRFGSRESYLDALAATDHDVLIIDAFYEGEQLTADDVARLRDKANGGTRLVIAYLSIGEAEDYRFYWQAGWNKGSPAWIDQENPDFAGNYKVHYWDSDWQDIVLSGGDSYLNRITGIGFDGVYLDLIDAFEFYEG